MKPRSWISFIVIIGLLLGVTPGNASAVSVTKAQAANVTKAFKTISTNLDTQATQANDDLNTGLDAAQKQYDSDMKKANDDYQQALLASNAKFQPQKTALLTAIEDANRSNNQLTFKVMVNNLSLCPTKKNGNCEAGDILVWGDKKWELKDAEFFVTIGGIVCTDEPTRIKNKTTIASSNEQIPIIDGRWQTETNALAATLLAKKNTIRETQYSANSKLNSDYQETSETVDATKVNVDYAILASGRAERDFAAFDQAFITAYEYQENLENLQAIADAPIIATILTLGFGNLVKVTKMLSQGNTVSDRYTLKGATAFNKTVGKVFVTKSAFRARIKDAQSVYLKLLPKGTVKSV